MRFINRREAGRLLARRLRKYAGRHDLVVFGLPRGGIAVAEEVAKALSAPLDVLCVRKIGVPVQPEVAMGAVAPGGVLLMDPVLTQALDIPAAEIDAAVSRERAELERREALYRGGRPFPDLARKTAIVVDDGVATGHTLRAALLSLARRGPARLIAAVPVCAARSCEGLRDAADEVVCLLTEDVIYAISQWYDDFRPVTDAEVVESLSRSARRRASPKHEAA